MGYLGDLVVFSRKALLIGYYSLFLCIPALPGVPLPAERRHVSLTYCRVTPVSVLRLIRGFCLCADETH